MNNRRPKNLARMGQRLVYGSSRNIYLRDATTLGIDQHDTWAECFRGPTLCDPAERHARSTWQWTFPQAEGKTLLLRSFGALTNGLTQLVMLLFRRSERRSPRSRQNGEPWLRCETSLSMLKFKLLPQNAHAITIGRSTALRRGKLPCDSRWKRCAKELLLAMRYGDIAQSQDKAACVGTRYSELVGTINRNGMPSTEIGN
jgi:hypothetical protein